MLRNRKIRTATRNDIAPFIMDIHYARRFPSITFAFGLEVNGELEGVITYGTPPSSTLRIGVAGNEYSDKVIELNRLCLKSNSKNDASWLVSKSLRLIEGNKIVVSFADTEQGHTGTVYQAANFLYTGLSAKRTDWKVRGREHLHGQTIADEFRGMPNRSTLMREKYGEDFYLAPRPRKHRYIYITGSRAFKKAALKSLKYKIKPYPQQSEGKDNEPT